VFTGPGGGPGQRGGPSVARGARTVLSRHNLHRTYHGAVAKLADPAVPLRPTARGVLRALRDGGPQHTDQLAAQLTATSRRPIRPATVATALGELHAAGLAAVDDHDQDEPTGRWTALPVARDPLLEAVDLHGAHDFRHPYATWLEDAGIPARVIDELMGHEASGQQRPAVRQRHGRPRSTHHPGDGRTGHQCHSATTDDRAHVAEESLENYPSRSAPECSDRRMP
jgi:hypothetical protein